VGPFIKSPEAGAQTSIFCCVEESLGGQSGSYYADCREQRPSLAAQSSEDAARLWELSEKLTGLKQG
jgi:hypothetical protein